MNKDKFRSDSMMIFYKVGHFFYICNLNAVAYFFQWIGLIITGNDIACSSEIDQTVTFPHPTGIVIGSGVCIEAGSVIFQNVTLGGKKDKNGILQYPKIGRNVTIYPGACVLGGIKLKNGTIIGANCVIVNNLEKGVYVSQKQRRIK